jgi:hypothetical protein
MLTKKDYSEAVNKYFKYLEIDFDYKKIFENKSNTLLYDVRYSNNSNIISISYEIQGDGVKVIIFMLQNGNIPDYDDKAHTLHLEYLMKDISNDDKFNKCIDENNNYFLKYNKPIIDVENAILKKAKELRLYLSVKIRWTPPCVQKINILWMGFQRDNRPFGDEVWRRAASNK